MKRLLVLAVVVLLLAAASLLIPDVRQNVRALLRPEPPPRITPLALVAPPTRARVAAALCDRAAKQHTIARTAPAASTTPPASATPTITPSPAPSPTPTQAVVNGRVYDAYIPAATKESQAYQYSCEFDAAWVILQTYGYDVSVDALIEAVGVDDSIEPYIEETSEGYIIHGGDIEPRSRATTPRTSWPARPARPCARPSSATI